MLVNPTVDSLDSFVVGVSFIVSDASPDFDVVDAFDDLSKSSFPQKTIAIANPAIKITAPKSVEQGRLAFSSPAAFRRSAITRTTKHPKDAGVIFLIHLAIDSDVRIDEPLVREIFCPALAGPRIIRKHRPVAMRWKLLLVVVEVNRVGDPQLAQLTGAIDALSGFLGFGESRQQHSRQYGDDGDDHQKFDQRKCGRASCAGGHSQ